MPEALSLLDVFDINGIIIFNDPNTLIGMVEYGYFNEELYNSKLDSIKYNSQKKSSNESYNNNADLQEYLLDEAFKSDDTIEDPIDLNVVKSKEDEYRLRQEKKNVDPKFSNKIIETVKNNLNNNDNYSIENYNDYQTEYNNLNEEITKTRPVSDYVSDDKDLQKFWENLEEST
jgi:hypothetical protein